MNVVSGPQVEIAQIFVGALPRAELALGRFRIAWADFAWVEATSKGTTEAIAAYQSAFPNMHEEEIAAELQRARVRELNTEAERALSESRLEDAEAALALLETLAPYDPDAVASRAKLQAQRILALWQRYEDALVVAKGDGAERIQGQVDAGATLDLLYKFSSEEERVERESEVVAGLKRATIKAEVKRARARMRKRDYDGAKQIAYSALRLGDSKELETIVAKAERLEEAEWERADGPLWDVVVGCVGNVNNVILSEQFLRGKSKKAVLAKYCDQSCPGVGARDGIERRESLECMSNCLAMIAPIPDRAFDSCFYISITKAKNAAL